MINNWLPLIIQIIKSITHLAGSVATHVLLCAFFAMRKVSDPVLFGHCVEAGLRKVPVTWAWKRACPQLWSAWLRQGKIAFFQGKPWETLGNQGFVQGKPQEMSFKRWIFHLPGAFSNMSDPHAAGKTQGDHPPVIQANNHLLWKLPGLFLWAHGW